MEGIIVRRDLAAALNVPQQAGYLVQRVSQESPAWRMGIRSGAVRVTIAGYELLIGGDIILSCNGIEVHDEASLESIYENIRKLEPGGTVISKVLRAGQIVEVRSVVGSNPNGP
jgi:serine protease Do